MEKIYDRALIQLSKAESGNGRTRGRIFEGRNART